MRYNPTAILILTTFLAISSHVPKSLARTVVEGKNSAILVTGMIESNQATEIVALDGSSTFSCFLTIRSPRKFEGQRIEILIADVKKSNLPKLAKNGDLITLRLRSAALDKKTDFIYDSEITDAFNPSALPDGYVSASELDQYRDIPSSNRPQLPESLKSDPNFTFGMVRKLVLINEQGEVSKIIPFFSSHPKLEEVTLQYIKSTKFKTGKKDGEPTGYYQYIVVVFSE